jgi:hypothetical protein
MQLPNSGVITLGLDGASIPGERVETWNVFHGELLKAIKNAWYASGSKLADV